MPGIRVENSPQSANRMRDISTWQEGKIASLSSREKKRYNKRKSAIEEYFTTEISIDELAHRFHLAPKILAKLADECLMQHEDGMPWGFRALLPGVTVVDHSPEAAPTASHAPEANLLPEEDVSAPNVENDNTRSSTGDSTSPEEEKTTILVEEAADDDDSDTAKRQAIKLSTLPSLSDLNMPETPRPSFIKDEDEEEMAASTEINEAALEIEQPAKEEDAAVEEQPTVTLEKTPLEEERPTVDAGDETFEEQPADKLEEAPLEEEDTSKLDTEVEEMQPRARVTMPLGVEVLSITGGTSLIEPVHSQRQVYAANKRIVQRRIVRKRWQRSTSSQHRQKLSLQIASLAIVAAALLFVLIPATAGLAAYNAYSNVSAVAHNGINHLLKVKSMFNISKSDPTAALAALNATTLTQAQAEFKAAQDDFLQLQQLVNRPDIQEAIGQFAPQYTSKLGMAQSLVQVGLDVTQMGYELSGVALVGANIIHGSPLAAASTKPLLSVANVTAIEGSLVHAFYYIEDIRSQMSHISIPDLPISAAQKAQLTSLLPLLPKAQSTIVQAQGLIGLVSWLLGVGQQRRFLIQTMDRGELRPGGGFTGQYGILQIQDGRMAPPSLTDVAELDYNGNGTAIGRKAPSGYSWMNFGNWGIRDSNLSADFPTTARMTMQLFQDEGGGPVDGDIAFTPVLIGHILDITGPIKVPGYNEFITSKNLEERLHYYQQDFSAIAREKQISGNYSHTGRKAFTSTLGKMLLDRVRHLSAKQLVNVVKGAIKDIQSHDLEMYFTNPSVEGWLIAHGYSASVDTFSQLDGFTVTQANISISKASQYVHTTEQDAVTLDAQGGATHNLTITLNYQQTGPVYGFDTYADYIRVYAPQSAVFLGGDGFDSGQPLCRPGFIGTPTPGTGTPFQTTGCGQYTTYFPSNARYCPNGDYALGERLLGLPWTIDSLGPPTAHTSDLSGRSMWGGLTETPKNCISYITLSWYVPHAVKKVNGQPSYTILIQKQSGYSPTIELTIDASAITGLKSFSFKGDINADKAFILSPPPQKK